MAKQVTIELSEDFYSVVEHVTRATGETWETVFNHWVTNPVPNPTQSNIDLLTDEIENYDLIQLWMIVYRKLPSELEARYQAIMEKQRAGQQLTAQEKSEWDAHVKLGELAMLLRAHALATLKARGANIDIYVNRELD